MGVMNGRAKMAGDQEDLVSSPRSPLGVSYPSMTGVLSPITPTVPERLLCGKGSSPAPATLGFPPSAGDPR